MNDKICLEITGKNPSYFFKEIIKRNINVYKVEKAPKSLKVTIEYRDLEEVLSIKTTYKVKITERYGLNKYKYLLKKYAVFLLFSCLGILLNILLSNMIFDIEVVHSNKNVVKTVTKDLQELGLKKYHFKVSYDKKEKIKAKLLEKEKDLLEWVEIEEKGTKYLIKIEQRKKNNDTTDCNYRHITAKKNAIIKEIEASAGEIIKKKNDYVTKGEVIVSGLIHNKENIVSKRCSIGKIYGEVWYTVTVNVPKINYEKSLTDNKKYGLSLTILKNDYNLLNNYRTFEKEEYNIIKSNIIPLKIALSKYIETKETTKKISKEEAIKEALAVATKKIESKLKSGEEILSKKVLKNEENNSKIRIEVFFKVKEDITDFLDITDLNIEEMNEEQKE